MKKGIVIAVCLIFIAGTVMAGKINVINEDFQVLPEGTASEDALGKVPYGWCATATGDGWSLELTNEKVLSGNYSMRVIRGPNMQGGVLTCSKPIEITPGKKYSVTAQIFNTIDMPSFPGRQLHLYLEFWPAEGGWWGDEDYWSMENWKDGGLGAWTTRGRAGVAFTGSKTTGQWEEVTVEGVAPDGAKYATISFWTSTVPVKSYVDGVVFMEE
jgi:hypothetical protein